MRIMIAVSPDRKLPIGADSGERGSGFKNVAPTKTESKYCVFDIRLEELNALQR
jgi:hypothetical protein